MTRCQSARTLEDVHAEHPTPWVMTFGLITYGSVGLAGQWAQSLRRSRSSAHRSLRSSVESGRPQAQEAARQGLSASDPMGNKSEARCERRPKGSSDANAGLQAPCNPASSLERATGIEPATSSLGISLPLANGWHFLSLPIICRHATRHHFTPWPGLSRSLGSILGSRCPPAERPKVHHPARVATTFDPARPPNDMGSIPRRDTSGGGTGADRPGPRQCPCGLRSLDAKQAQEANEELSIGLRSQSNRAPAAGSPLAPHSRGRVGRSARPPRSSRER